ncbi:hypothetical protein CTAYLR_003972 [Chrysophaeum taylorii]|uniref:Uncharacterized protein n=1 Tax=Chrysophaeum taylorii TaxID=2483200 RepID=A0AAD7UGI2_9STRA|nr:hypothetical protein CTAYLR_003972 [Chrysophaeum taylorii]
MLLVFIIQGVVVVAVVECPRLGKTALSSSSRPRGVLEELERSIPAVTHSQSELVAFPYPRDTVVVVDQRVVVHRSFLEASKHAAHLRFVKSVVDRRRVVNAAYRFSAGTRGVKRCDGWPFVVIAKVAGYDQCGILAPNPYFDLLRERPVVVRPPGTDRRVLWRGNITGRSCDKNAGNVARLAAASLTVMAPELFDVRCIHCSPRYDVDECASVVPSREYGATAPTVGYTTLMRELARDPDRIRGSYVPQSEFSNHTFLLHLPGAFTGSYSRNLNSLWSAGGAVLIWDASYVEFYFPALAHGITHLAVNLCNAKRTVEGLDAARIATLASNARRVYDAWLCPDCLAAYYQALLAALPSSPGVVVVNKGNCTEGLVEILGARPHVEDNKFYRALPSTHLITRPFTDCNALLNGFP